MRRLLYLVLLLASPCFAVTHYISKTIGGASDSNNGTSKATPWLHMPGMATCTANCAGYSPTGAGDQIILYGGDTWTEADLGINWNGWGNDTTPVYVGVDITWFNSSVCGASFCRPIFNAHHNALAQASDDVINIFTNAHATHWDNIEITQTDGAGSAVFDSNPNQEISNFYIHGWATATNNNAGCFTGSTSTIGSSVHDSICDGTDTSQNWYNGFTGQWPLAYNNVVRYVVSGVLAEINVFHDNLVSNMVTSAHGDHCNGLSYSPVSAGGTTIYYNNIVAFGSGCSGGIVWWANGALGTGGGCSGCTAYIFDNILYNDQNGITTGGHPSVSDGTFNIFSNTIDTGALGGTNCMGNGEPSPRMTVNYSNNHCILGSGSTICVNTGATCTDGGGNLAQTEAVANAAGYTSSQTYVYSPTAGGSPTVGNGVNDKSICTTLSGVNAAAGTACNSDTTYSISYNTTNHTVVSPARAVNGRPSSGAWDTGGYEFTSGGSQASPPSCSPGTGNYTTTQTVTCTNPNGGTTVMCYNTTGSPVTNGLGTGCTTGTKYTTTLSISAPETLYVVAGTSTLTDSSIVSYTYSFTVATPTFSPIGGGYPNTQTVTITAQVGATICYTVDGSTPTATTPGTCSHGTTLANGGTITVSVSETVNALGTESGLTNSAIGTATYTIGGIQHVNGACTSEQQWFANTGSGTITCTPNAAGDQIPIFGQCHPVSGIISGITLTASGYTVGGSGLGSINQIVAPASTGSNSWGATFGVIALNTSPVTFTMTFTGASDCNNYSVHLNDELSGGNQTGGTTTFNATGSNSGAAGTCNQTAANVTPPLNNEAVWVACLLGSATTATSPWTLGSNDGVGNSAEYQILSGGAGVAQTPAFNGTSGAYIVEGVAIAPAGSPPPPMAGAVGMMLQ